MATARWLDVNGDWNNTANWSTGSVPVNGDTVYIESGSQNITSNLNQSAVTLAALYVGAAFTGDIGSSSAYLQIGATLATIGYHYGPGTPTHSDRIKIDFGSVQTTTQVMGSASFSADDLLEPVRLKGTHASNVLEVVSGLVGFATTNASETGTLATARVVESGGSLRVGSGVTLTTAYAGDGALTVGCAATTLEVSGGTLLTHGTGAVTTVRVRSGSASLESSGTITTLVVGPGARASFAGDARAKTVTNCEVYSGSTLDLDNGVPLSVTLTNGVDHMQCAPTDVTIIASPHLTWTPSTI